MYSRIVSSAYPPDVIDRTLSRFLKNKEKEPAAVEPAKPVKKFLKLWYVNRKCEDFAHHLKILVVGHFTQVDLNVAFKTPATIGEMFPFKDKVKNKLSRSLVVYSMKCKTCKSEYIGKTERIMGIRIDEHENKNKDKRSACKQHIELNPTHEWDYGDVEILDPTLNCIYPFIF